MTTSSTAHAVVEVCPVYSYLSCNPVAQALILNKENTDMNVLIGLCVGHDMVVTKLSNAPVTTLIAKDRRLNHNPASVLYTYYGRGLVQKELSQKR